MTQGSPAEKLIADIQNDEETIDLSNDDTKKLEEQWIEGTDASKNIETQAVKLDTSKQLKRLGKELRREASEYKDDSSTETDDALKDNLEYIASEIETIADVKEIQEGGNKTDKEVAASGFSAFIDKASNTIGKVGEWFGKIWEGLKPQLSKIAAIPGISFVLGKEKMGTLYSWLGYNPDMIEMRDMVKARLGNDVLFDITNNQELTALNDKYILILKKKNADSNAYAKEVFMAELMAKATTDLIPTLPVNQEGKRELFVTQLLPIADTLIKESTPIPKTDIPKPEPTA